LNRAEELATEFAEGMLRSRRSRLAEVIDGEQSVVAALVDLTATARTDVAVLDSPPYLSVAASAAAERSLMSRECAVERYTHEQLWNCPVVTRRSEPWSQTVNKPGCYHRFRSSSCWSRGRPSERRPYEPAAS
jgi:hypothetical protein